MLKWLVGGCCCALLGCSQSFDLKDEYHFETPFLMSHPTVRDELVKYKLRIGPRSEELTDLALQLSEAMSHTSDITLVDLLVVMGSPDTVLQSNGMYHCIYYYRAAHGPMWRVNVLVVNDRVVQVGFNEATPGEFAR